MNLAVNARDAMPHGGQLTIETGQRRARRQRMPRSMSAWPPGRYVMLAVTRHRHRHDADDAAARLFEPFFTTKERGKGTGLGPGHRLRHRQAERRPRLGRTAKLGQGSTLQGLSAARRRRRPSARSPWRREPLAGTETVLVVEDEARCARCCATSARRRGYRVLEAAIGDEAVRHRRRSTDARSICCSPTWSCPGMSGPSCRDAGARAARRCKVLSTCRATPTTRSCTTAMLDAGRRVPAEAVRRRRAAAQGPRSVGRPRSVAKKAGRELGR